MSACGRPHAHAAPETYKPDLSRGEREMRILRALGALIFLFCAAAIEANAQTVQSDFDKSYDFTKLKTFNFAMRDFDDVLAQDTLNDGRVRAAIQTNLTANGYRVEESETPDFAVAYYVTARNKFNIQDTGPRFWGRRDVSVDEYTEGTLGVDIYEVRTGRLVWRGRAVGTVEMKGTDKKINKAAEKLVKQFLKDTRKGG